MVLNFLIDFLASILFLFLFWTRLKEDYTQNQIFTTGFYVLLGIGSGNILAVNFFRDWWLWSGFLGGVIGLLLGIRRFRLRFFETLEAFVISGLSLFLVVSISDCIGKYSIDSLALCFGIASFIILFVFLDKHYRKFSWYKSGRVGFSGLTVLGTFFLVRSIVAMIYPHMLSFAGDIEVVVSGVLSFLSYMAVYNLSGKT